MDRTETGPNHNKPAPASTDRLAAMRHTMVDQIAGRLALTGRTMPTNIEQVLRRVPRHLFAPEASAELAYADDTVATRWDPDGTVTSCVSAPWLQAVMLDQAAIEPRMNILEVGSGGYNAALLRELVGPAGQVVTIDVDPQVVTRARACLAAAGYPDVRVLHADGERGADQHAPYDRIIVTAASWDIPPTWPAQLAPGGRLVVPLRTFGLTRSWVLVRRDDHLHGDEHVHCGFVPMRGTGAHRGRTIPLHAESVSLLLDEEPQPQHEAPAETLDGILDGPREAAWSDVTAGWRESYGSQDLWLATHLPSFGILSASQRAVEDGIVNPSWIHSTPAFVDGGTLAYRAKPRPIGPGGPEPVTYEFGAYGHGPKAADMTTLMADEIHRWDQRDRPEPSLSIWPAGTASSRLPHGTVVDKKHTRAVISWPEAP